jgi:nitrite reductase/ring-hydroxylating ferredoxin subunit
MAEFIRVASIGEIPVGESRLFEIAGHQIAIFNVGGHLHAIDNVCPHQGGPLAEGELDGCIVTCPWHGWTYDVTTGISPDAAEVHVPRFAVRVDGDDVSVDLGTA